MVGAKWKVMRCGFRSDSFKKAPHRALRYLFNNAATHGLIGNRMLRPIGDRMITGRRVLASDRDDRANLLGSKYGQRSAARRIRQTRHLPYTHIITDKKDDPRPQCHLRRCRMSTDMAFKSLTFGTIAPHRKG